MAIRLIMLGLLSLCVISRGQTPDSRTMFQYLQDEGFNKLVEFLYGAGMTGELQNMNAFPFTLMAPTDAAINTLGGDVLVQLETNTTLLREFLNGHLLDETIFSLFLRDGMTKTAMNGDKLVFNSYSNGAKTVNGAVLGKNDLLTNGVVYSIDRVLTPLSPDISTYIAHRDSQFRDLFGFLVLSRLVDTLAGEGPFTLFAPTDSIFQSMDFSAYISDRALLADFLKHHVVAGNYWSAGLVDGMTLTTLNGDTITVHKSSSGVMVDGATVVMPDIGTSNGVIHVINAALVPPIS